MKLYNSVEQAIAINSINSLLASIEDTKVFNGGDPAFYAVKKGNVLSDFIKRTGPSVSCIVSRIFKNEDGTWAVNYIYISCS